MAGEINFYSPSEPKFRDQGPSRTPYFTVRELIPLSGGKPGRYSHFFAGIIVKFLHFSAHKYHS